MHYISCITFAWKQARRLIGKFNQIQITHVWRSRAGSHCRRLMMILKVVAVIESKKDDTRKGEIREEIGMMETRGREERGGNIIRGGPHRRSHVVTISEVDQPGLFGASMWANNAHFGRSRPRRTSLRSIIFRTRFHAAAAVTRRGYSPYSTEGASSRPRGWKMLKSTRWKFATCQVASSRATWEPTCALPTNQVDIENHIPPSAEVWRQNPRR